MNPLGKGSAPAAPDPYASAAAQYQYGTQAANYTTQLGHTNVVTPYGSTTYSEGAPSAGGYDNSRATGTGISSSGFPVNQIPGGVQSSDQAGKPSYSIPSMAVGATGYFTPPRPQPSSYNLQAGGPSGSSPSMGLGGGQGFQGPPQYTQTTTLSPNQQALLNLKEGTQIGVGQQAMNNLQQPINAPTLQRQIDTRGVADRSQQAQEAAYRQQTQYLDPQYSQQQESLDAQLRNSGAHPGDPAYDNAMKLFTNQKQQAYSSAEDQAVQQGLREQSQLFGQQAEQQAAENTAASQQLAQDIQLRDLPLNESQALAGAGGTPSFGLGGGSGGGGGGGQVAAPDISGLFQNKYQGQLAGYNAKTATTNADVGAVATIAAAVI